MLQDITDYKTPYINVIIQENVYLKVNEYSKVGKGDRKF